MDKLPDTHRRVLTEMIGECWHGYTDDVTPSGEYRMCLCGYAYIIPEKHQNRTFITGNDMVAVKEAIERSGEWWNFYQFCLYEYIDSGNPNPMFPHNFFAWLLQPERFCYLAAEFEMKREGKDG